MSGTTNNNKTIKFGASVRLLKAKGRELLFSGENHISLLLAILAVGVTAALPIAVSGMFYPFVSDGIYTLILLGLEFLFLSPLLTSVSRMSMRMSSGERVRFYEVFDDFSSVRTYLRSIAFSLVETVIFALTLFLAIMVAYFFSNDAAESFGNSIVPLALAAVVGTLSVMLVIFMIRLIPARAIFAMKGKVFSSIKTALKLTRKKTFKIVCIFITLLPLIFISVALVCLPLLIYTAPYMICIYGLATEKLLENNKDDIER